MSDELISQIDDYLSSGGLFNPELMDHEKVRDLLIEARATARALIILREQYVELLGDFYNRDLRLVDTLSVIERLRTYLETSGPIYETITFDRICNGDNING